MATTEELRHSVVAALPGARRIVDTVVKVHGANHPNLTDVQTHFNELSAAVQEDNPDAAAIREAQSKLRESADGFETPADGCDGYKMMNEQLSGIDSAVTDLVAAN